MHVQNEERLMIWMAEQGLTETEAETAMRRGRLFLRHATPASLQPKVDYLRSIGLCVFVCVCVHLKSYTIGVQNIRNVLFKRPTTVGMRLESLRTKVEFLKTEYGLTEPEIARIVTNAPAFLSLKVCF